jgi:EAL domain-containing protein (putative c-di-GMP-specific phosphodiesterase class I)
MKNTRGEVMKKTEGDLYIDSLEIYHIVQPIVELNSKEIHGFEFLLRSSKSPNPEMLFSQALERNLLLELDMKSIFTIIENVHMRNFKYGYIFINVYPSTFVEPIFLYKLMQLISLTNINTNSIVLELNEAEKIDDLSEFGKFVDKYRQKGFLISIDDLGKGEANLQVMLEIQPDIVKLDRYFSKNLYKSKEKKKVIEFCLDILDGKATVILEGIECEEDLQVAQQLGVPFAQGYYLGRPNSTEYYIQKKVF